MPRSLPLIHTRFSISSSLSVSSKASPLCWATPFLLNSSILWPCSFLGHRNFLGFFLFLKFTILLLPSGSLLTFFPSSPPTVFLSSVLLSSYMDKPSTQSYNVGLYLTGHSYVLRLITHTFMTYPWTWIEVSWLLIATVTNFEKTI